MNVNLNLAHSLLFVWLCFISMHASGQGTLLLLDFEFVDELSDPRTAEADRNRLLTINHTLSTHLQSCDALRIVDPAPAQAEITQARARMSYVHRCNGCAKDFGEAAQAQYVLFPWVQKVSNLILNLNARIRSATTDQLVAVRSVDIRGNTDRSWMRGAKALAVRICELDGHRLSSASTP